MSFLRRFLCVLSLTLCLTTAACADTLVSESDEPALALGSGGAGGLAHIAMLGVFDELERRPAHIAGTSIGAVIGALYAAGLSAEEIEALFRDFDGDGMDVVSGFWNSELDLTDLLDSGLDEGGVLDPQGFLDYLAEQVEARRFEDLEIPLSVTATDFWSGEVVVIEEGDLFEALAASMAVPGLFKPVERGDQLLLDGGLSDPLPYLRLMESHATVIAVDVSGTREPGSEETGLTKFLFKSFEVMQQSIIRQMRQQGEPDLYLKPNTEGIRLLHFNRLSDILEKAEPEADRLREFLADH